MRKHIKDGWNIVSYESGEIYLYDENRMVKSASTGYTPVPKGFNVHVNNNKISVRTALRRSYPKLPMYLKEGILSFVKEVKGEGDYVFTNK